MRLEYCVQLVFVICCLLYFVSQLHLIFTRDSRMLRASFSRVFAIFWASVRPSVCLSVCLSVCHTRDRCQNGAS